MKVCIYIYSERDDHNDDILRGGTDGIPATMLLLNASDSGTSEY